MASTINAPDKPVEQNLWNQILNEASRSISDRLDSQTLVILGTLFNLNTI